VVFGDYNPSGRLTATFPRNVGQIPIYYRFRSTGRPNPGDTFEKFKSNYLDSPNSPLWPFGYGLSYTNFEYAEPELSKKEITMDEELEVSIQIANTGSYDGEEVVQLYIRDEVASLTRPVMELKGFRKTLIKAGESEEVRFTLNSQDLGFYDNDMNYRIEPGKFRLYISRHALDTAEYSTFELK
jgi:beta-glucosidase